MRTAGDADTIPDTIGTPDDLANAVVHVIDQPWGISISDVTVRASGESTSSDRQLLR